MLTRRPGLVQPAMLLLTGALVIAPLVFVQRYYDQAWQDGKTNQPVLQTLDGVARYGRLDEHVYLDDQLREVRTMSGGRLLEHLQMAFAMRGQEYEIVDVENARLPIGRRREASRILVLRQDDVELANDRYKLEPLSGERGPGAVIRVFRAFSRDGAEASAQP